MVSSGRATFQLMASLGSPLVGCWCMWPEPGVRTGTWSSENQSPKVSDFTEVLYHARGMEGDMRSKTTIHLARIKFSLPVTIVDSNPVALCCPQPGSTSLFFPLPIPTSSSFLTHRHVPSHLIFSATRRSRGHRQRDNGLFGVGLSRRRT